MKEEKEKILGVIKEAKNYIYGQDNLIRAIVAALINEGHLLIEGAPGLGKTLSVSVLSKLCDLVFKRIQFTPDLMPSDLIGSLIYSPKKEDFIPKFGSIFTQILLADEINRAPAKVQSALLESMEEGQVTIGDSTHQLSNPYVVLATQNPIEHEGTYSLPEAQMDRFMMKVEVNYPSVENEKKILNFDKVIVSQIKPMLSIDDINRCKKVIESIYVDDKIKEMVVKMVNSLRPSSSSFIADYQGLIRMGPSPRASLWLIKIAKFNALLEGRDFVTPENVIQSAREVLVHRVALTYDAYIEKVDIKKILNHISEVVL